MCKSPGRYDDLCADVNFAETINKYLLFKMINI